MSEAIQEMLKTILILKLSLTIWNGRYSWTREKEEIL